MVTTAIYSVIIINIIIIIIRNVWRWRVHADEAREERPMLVRLRTKVGINEFQDTTPSGHTDDDYMHPFRGLHGLKHSLAIYLMKSVDPNPPIFPRFLTF